MTGTSNVFAHVEPELKEQAEAVLNRLGIPMSNAIGIFLRQVVLRQGIPFEVRIPPATLPVCATREQLEAALEKGYADYQSGQTQDASNAFVAIEQEFGL